MTPEERADMFCIKNGIHPKWSNLFAAQIREVVEETHCKLRCGCFAYDQAFAEGHDRGLSERCLHIYEDAAKTLEMMVDYYPGGIQEFAEKAIAKIRSRAREVGK